jgi:hypothetical protein
MSALGALRKVGLMRSVGGSVRAVGGPAGMRLVSLLALVVGCLVVCSVPAFAAQAWRIDSLSDTTAAPGATYEYLVQVTNVGDADMDGSEIDVIGALPSGITAVDGRLILDTAATESNFVSCTAGDGVSPLAGASDVRCVNSDPLHGPGSWQLLRLRVRVDLGASGPRKATFAVSGGGAGAASTVDPIQITNTLPVFGIDAFDGQLTDAAGNPFTQAGGHPASASVSFGFNTYTNAMPLGGSAWPVEPVKDTLVDLPPGLVGDPTGVDQCTLNQLAGINSVGNATLCPPTAQVGTILVRTGNRPFTPESLGPLAVYNMVPPPNAPARFGFLVAGTAVVLDASVRSGGDYGISVNSRNISEALPVAGGTFTFWGVPSDPSHDAERACSGSGPPGLGGPSCVTHARRVAFLRNPTMCSDAGLPTTMRIDSWTNPGVFQSFTFRSHLPPAFPEPPSDQGPEQGPTGCGRVPFSPTLGAQPGQATPNAPSQFAFDLSLPQTDDPDIVGESDVRTAVVTLPAGVRVNPAAADGLQACSTAQIHLHDDNAPACPDAAKVGSVTVTTPLLRDPLEGRIYLATPHDNPFGTLLSIYLVAEGAGVTIKLAGRVEANPITGQLTATFDDNPQTPFTNLHLTFDGGPRAQLVTPRQCGSYTTTAILTGWNGRVVESDPTFTISGDGQGGACPGPKFAPVMSAGTASNSAGSFSTLKLRFTRDDQDQEISGLSVDLPGGLTGKIASVDLCGAAQAAAGTCGEGSKVGDVTVGAGAGTNPFFITNGRAYLTGPYKGAPYGMSIVVPAKAGPFDLGNVVVRSALFVDKHTADVRVVSDPLPTILQGIPLQVRDVRVDVNKPKFILNPTSCAEMRITGVLSSTEGVRANVSDRFEAVDCGSLGFRPRMVMRVGGRGHTRRGQTSPFTTTLTMPARNQANLRFVRVSLPTTINARLNTINDACTRAEFESDIRKCSHAIAGSAIASTPLLRDPLKGNVYFVKNGNPIPDLFVALRGQVAFDLIGRISIPGGKHLATTFATAPDVPVRSFTLRLLGGPTTASIGAAANLCSAKSRRATAAVDYIAQNGRVLQRNQRLKVAGCAHRHRKARHRTH